MSGRSKRQAKVLEESNWDCSVCTYRNTAEAFKCLMCDVRKGTSTRYVIIFRKPRINQQIVAQQYSPPTVSSPVSSHKVPKSENGTLKETSEPKNSDKSGRRSWPPPRLKNVDRSSGQTREVTVNNITVMITEYKLKPKHLQEQDQSDKSDLSSSPSESEADSDSPGS